MTVSSTATTAGPYVGNGATTSFPFSFKALSPAEVDVLVDGGVIGGGYTVSLNDDGEGGAVTFDIAPASAKQILLRSAPSFQQSIRFQNNGAFLPQTHEEGLDRGAARDLYLLRLIESIPEVDLSQQIEAAATARQAAESAATNAEGFASDAATLLTGVGEALSAGTVSDLVGTRIYTSRAALEADLTPADNLYALVIGDATAANNDLYQKNGATGAGSWDGPLGFLAAASAESQELRDETAGIRDETRAALNDLAIDTSVLIGRPVTPADGSSSPTGNVQIVFGDAAAHDGTVDWVEFWAEAAGTVEVFVAEKSGATFTVVEEASIVVSSSGLKRHAVSLPIKRGQYVGFNGVGVVGTSASVGFLDGVGWGAGNGAGSDSFTLDAAPIGGLGLWLQFTAHIATRRTFPDRLRFVPDLDFDWCHYLTTGQSLSVGSYAGLISSTPSAKHKTFNVGPKMTKPGISGGLNPDDGAVKALVEDSVSPNAASGSCGETSCFRFAAGFTNRFMGRNAPTWFASAAGIGSQTLTTLSKGWSADLYGQSVYHVQAAWNEAQSLGLSYACPYILVAHGESDQGLSRSKAAYRSYIDSNCNNLAADILAITGTPTGVGRKAQTVPPVFLFLVPNLNITTSGAAGEAILEACEVRPDCWAVLPNYRLPQASGHPTAKGQALIGEYAARAAAELAAGREPGRVKWGRAVANGTSLTAYATAPTPLQIDTGFYGATTDRGIKIVDGTGTLTLSGIAVGTAVLDPVTGLYETPITMTLNRTLGANPRFRYARDYAGAGDTTTASAGGNICDTTTETVTIDGETFAMIHAAFPVEMPISVRE